MEINTLPSMTDRFRTPKSLGLLLPICNFKTPSDFDYKTSCCNGDLLRIIQLGMTLCNENGRKPEGKCVWQFNFCFNLNDDMYAPDSIELLQTSGPNSKRDE
ncbi:hypothetical protein MJO28_001086 [Puccinia striiformis f. sp. tritici]|uniref:Uncharacterized protein n=1 Tax=Puccinia striiformis f. sp. tritici TaxID=168172 RepID=A0ACC0EZT8_9BASI|nr:hypothetical protein MJO28_001086 [Puccinia striiformis f. sp. tritici]